MAKMLLLAVAIGLAITIATWLIPQPVVFLEGAIAADRRGWPWPYTYTLWPEATHSNAHEFISDGFPARHRRLGNIFLLGFAVDWLLWTLGASFALMVTRLVRNEPSPRGDDRQVRGPGAP